MKIRLLSDVHLEFLGHEALVIPYLKQVLPEEQDDHETFLVIAGDFCCSTGLPEKWGHVALTELLGRFDRILYVWGNHEYYYGYYKQGSEDYAARLPENLREALEADRLTIAANTVVVCDYPECDIIAGTMWTDFQGGHPQTEVIGQFYMNDYRRIRLENGSDQKIKPVTIKQTAQEAIENIKSNLEYAFERGKPAIVVTHHLPTLSAVNKIFRYADDPDADRLNYLYASDLDYLLHADYAPKYWLCGHTHTPFDQVVGNTQVVINPVGYPDEEHRHRGPLEYRSRLSLVI